MPPLDVALTAQNRKPLSGSSMTNQWPLASSTDSPGNPKKATSSPMAPWKPGNRRGRSWCSSGSSKSGVLGVQGRQQVDDRRRVAPEQVRAHQHHHCAGRSVPAMAGVAELRVAPADDRLDVVHRYAGRRVDRPPEAIEGGAGRQEREASPGRLGHQLVVGPEHDRVDELLVGLQSDDGVLVDRGQAGEQPVGAMLPEELPERHRQRWADTDRGGPLLGLATADAPDHAVDGGGSRTGRVEGIPQGPGQPGQGDRSTVRHRARRRSMARDLVGHRQHRIRIGTFEHGPVEAVWPVVDPESAAFSAHPPNSSLHPRPCSPSPSPAAAVAAR